MERRSRRFCSLLILPLALATLVAMLSNAAAQGTGPFGVGLPEPAASATGSGFLSGFFAFIAAKQSAFYRELTAAIGAMKQDGSAFWLLGGLAFLYGVFHAAGPGHGKAVVSSYLLANRQALRNGIILSFASAFAQAFTAVALVAIAAIVLGMTSMAMTEAAYGLEIGSYALVTILGGWLVWTRVVRPAASWATAALAPRFAGAGSAGSVSLEGDAHDHHHHHHHHHHHDRACGCGHAHMPDPELVAGPLDWRNAWSVVASVGLRPCTGAIIALVFALSQGMFAAGMFAAFVMAIGTGLTVSVLAALTVGARGIAVRLAGSGSPLGTVLHRSLEAAGSFAVLLLGLVLLTASLGR